MDRLKMVILVLVAVVLAIMGSYFGKQLYDDFQPKVTQESKPSGGFELPAGFR